jgi:hypothetical protein
MSDDFEELLTPTKPVEPVSDRKSAAEARIREAKLQAEIKRAGSGQIKVSEEEFLVPCTQNFLARVLNMDPMTVRKRLVKCKPCGSVGNNRPVYLFHDAIQYLIKPKMDLSTYLRTLNPTDMPNSINKVYWEAERIKNKVMIETGEAWPTERIINVLGSVFMMIKDRMPLITESIRDLGASDAVQAKLTEMTDQFQRDLHAALVEMPKNNQSFSRQAEIDPMDETSGFPRTVEGHIDEVSD